MFNMNVYVVYCAMDTWHKLTSIQIHWIINHLNWQITLFMKLGMQWKIWRKKTQLKSQFPSILMIHLINCDESECWDCVSFDEERHFIKATKHWNSLNQFQFNWNDLILACFAHDIYKKTGSILFQYKLGLSVKFHPRLCICVYITHTCQLHVNFIPFIYSNIYSCFLKYCICNHLNTNSIQCSHSIVFSCLMFALNKSPLNRIQMWKIRDYARHICTINGNWNKEMEEASCVLYIWRIRINDNSERSLNQIW